MRKPTSFLLAALLAHSLACGSSSAQGFGSATQEGYGLPAGLGGNPGDHHNRNPHLEVEAALSMITIEGTAIRRVAPSEIRLVLAVISEAESSDLCQTSNAEQVAKVRTAWTGLGFPEERMVEDFISVLPAFSWHRDSRDEHEVLIQKRSGYRMQSNLHLAVGTESEAMSAIRAAFANGASDIITFDYWSPELDSEQEKARAAALTAARDKSDILLAAFDQRPPLINLQEQTRTFLPHSLYRTFQNVLEETASFPRAWRELPQIHSYRPKLTFFDGLKTDADVRPATLSLKPMIEVISTVRLYYQSPATKAPLSPK